MSNRQLLGGFLATALALTACGGSNTGGASSNRPPVADAGQGRAAQIGEVVLLDGAASADPDGDSLTYAWSFGLRPAGSAATLTSPNGRQTTFTPDVAGSYVIMLVTSDGSASSPPALVVVTAGQAGGGGQAPVASAGADQSTWPGRAVLLLGTGSWDPLGRSLTYSWQVTSAPAGATPSLTNPASATPSFSADAAGTYVVALTVVAAGGPSASDAVTVTVSNPSPVADAGGNRTVPIRAAVTLQGSGSDPDGTAVDFAWVILSAPAASTASLSGATTATPSLTPDVAGPYVVQLTVSNASGQATSTATLTAINPPPVVNPGGNRAAYVGNAVTLDAQASDPDGEPLTITWTLVNRPTGSTAALTSTATAVTTLVPDVPGQYLVSLLVSDPSATLPEQVVTITAYPAMAPLSHRVLDAEYSKALDAIVMIDEAPNALYVYDPVAKTEKRVLLPLASTAVSVSPDGLKAAVGHNGYVTHVDLAAGAIIKTWPVSAILGDVVLAGNGYAYIFPETPSFDTIHALDLTSGAETKASSFIGFEGTRARLHPSGTSIYGADNYVSPADIRKFDISAGAAVTGYDSPYHGDYAMCGNLWLSEDGARIFTACGNVFRATSTRATDMTYAGALEATGAVRSLADSTTAGEVLAVPGTGYLSTGHEDESILVFASDFLTRKPSVAVSPFITAAGTFAGHGRFVFWSADASRRYALVQADATSAMLKDFAVLSF